MRSNIITSGAITSIHCPKLIPRFKPSGSFKNFIAIMLGGVPIGVPIPPKLAANGIDIVSAIRPFPSAGSDANTGVRNVNISAAVAVLDINIENIPVMKRKPNSTFSLFLPKGRIIFFANNVSSPDLDAAIARMNPAKNNMIIGSANDAIMSLDFNSSPIPSPLNTLNEFSDTVMHIMVIIDNDVAHAGIHSVSHDSVAKTKIAIMRCCTTVRPSISNTEMGRFQTMAVIATIPNSCHTFFISMCVDNVFKLLSDIVKFYLI